MSEVSHSSGGRSCDRDEAVLQQTISTGVSGAEQILQVIEKGTAEMKTLVLEEADIVLECKYVSLQQFIALSARKNPIAHIVLSSGMIGIGNV